MMVSKSTDARTVFTTFLAVVPAAAGVMAGTIAMLGFVV